MAELRQAAPASHRRVLHPYGQHQQAGQQLLLCLAGHLPACILLLQRLRICWLLPEAGAAPAAASSGRELPGNSASLCSIDLLWCLQVCRLSEAAAPAAAGLQLPGARSRAA